MKTGFANNLFWARKWDKPDWRDHKQVTAMKDWCLDHIGIDHNRTWYYRDYTFYFLERKHLVLFLLKWSE